MIRTSFFELFKIGPGPSSSHTVGPMFAANRFRNEVLEVLQNRTSQSWRIQIDLFGSLADTGKGHGTDKAVLGGLYGYTPIDGFNTLFRLPMIKYNLTKRILFFIFSKIHIDIQMP